MWVEHKASDGDTLQLIARKYKNKDAQAILKYPGNRKYAEALRKGVTLKKGDKVWVLDPKSKVYIIKTKKGDQLLDERQYKEYLKNVHKTMDAVRDKIGRKLKYALMRHDAQRKINDDQWFVSSIVGAFSSVSEPTGLRKKAEAAYSKLESATGSRNYRQFEKIAFDCDKIVTRYQNEVYRWVDGLIGTAETSVATLTVIKEAGIFCGTVAAVTIAAPASLGAAIVVGGASNAGVNLVFDGYEQIGRAAAGTEPMSYGELGTRFASNALTGMAGAAVAGSVLKLVKGPFVKLISSNAFVKQQAARLSAKVIPNRVFQSEIQSVANKLSAQGSKVSVDEYIKALSHDRIMVEALTKFLVRVGTGAFSKHFGVGKVVHGKVETWVKTGPKALKTKDQKAVAEAAAKQLLKDGAADDFFDGFIKSNMKDFQKELNAVLTEHGEKYAKKKK